MSVQNHPNRAQGTDIKCKKGETIRQIFELINEYPGISFREMIPILKRNSKTIWAAYKKLIGNPGFYSAVFNLPMEPLKIHLRIVEYLKKDSEIKKDKDNPKYIKASKGKSRGCNRKKWRGKGNWPATIAARKKSVSNRTIVCCCPNAYDYDKDKNVYEYNSKVGTRTSDTPKTYRFL